MGRSAYGLRQLGAMSESVEREEGYVLLYIHFACFLISPTNARC